MTELLLKRYSYSPTETEGYLYLDDDSDPLHTLERPWRSGAPGGLPFTSCVPDGTYDLLPHKRPDGTDVLALRNPHLGVFYTSEEKGARPGRFLICLHAANFVEQVVGCIAPGMQRTIHDNRRMVTASRVAMARIMRGDWRTIHIVPSFGTEE